MLLNRKKYQRVCMVCTVYSLLEYLLYSSIEEINNTFFVFEDWMWKDFGDKFNNAYRMSERGFNMSRNTAWLYFKYVKWFKLPNYRNSELFTLDHLPHHTVFIGHHKYTLLEDGPYCHSVMLKNNLRYSTYEEKKYEHLPTFKKRMAHRLRKLVYGPVYYNRWGKCHLCTDLILSTDDDLYYFKNKTVHHIDFKGIWSTFSSQKQDLILKAFDLNQDDIELLVSKKIIILTQPLFPDYISEQEHGDIWRKIISKYPIEEVLVKPHPRDFYPYENDFEDLSVFRKKIPSQFFEVLNLEFHKAVTTFTSAVFGLNVKEIDWYGTEVSETIHDRIGSKPFIPDGMMVNHCKL